MKWILTLSMAASLHLGLSSLGFSQSYEAPSFCDADYLSDCSSLDSDFCLEKFHACGEYNAIIQHIGSLAYGGTSEAARYYKGISNYGLFVRNRTQSLKCQHAYLARQELTAYLYNKLEGSYRTQTDFNRVYQAAKIIDRLQTVDGCLESGLTEPELRYLVQNYSSEILKSLFIGGAIEGALGDQIDEAKGDIQAVIGSFVSNGAAIETQLGLREVAVDAAYQRFASIAQLFNQDLGNGSFSFDGDGNIALNLEIINSKGLGRSESNAANWRQKVGDVEAQWLAAIGDMNINDYDTKRRELVDRAEVLSSQATTTANFAGRLLDPTRTTGIRALEDALSAENQLPDFDAVVDEIEESWATSSMGSFKCLFGSQSWYCPIEETTSFMQVQE